MKPSISVVLPTKEEEGVFHVISKLKKAFGKNVEIVIVDKSGKGYHKRLERTGATVIWQKDKGVENAIIEGMKHTHADILATVDADDTHDTSGIVQGYKLVKANKADLVLGDRTADIEQGAMSGYLKFGNGALSTIYNMFYRQKARDVLTGLQVMKREVYENAKDNRFFKMEILFFQIEAARSGYRIVDVPIRYYVRKYGESKLTKSKFLYGFSTAWHIMKRSPYCRSFAVFGSVGIVLMIIGVVEFLDALLLHVAAAYVLAPLVLFVLGLASLMLSFSLKL
jgi:dolichol-phosphate mannosyltransferase